MSQREEPDNPKAYVDPGAVKQDEISAGQTQLWEKMNQLGNTDEKIANDRQDLEDTHNSLGADRKYLANLKDRN